ncbi:MAG: DDE-type integrase/transposase/recombinase [Solirubrobacteraceae bacterium]
MQDLFSHRIVGWSMNSHMRSELVVAALQMAVEARRPPRGTVHHSEHGGQYIGLSFGQAAHDAGIAQSMGAVGSCFDNAVAETFFATLTKERLLHDAPKGGWPTRAELRSAVFEYIEGFYNPTRLHSILAMRSPDEYEVDHAAGDPDGLARTSTGAGAREKAVHKLRLRTATTTTNLTPRNRGRSREGALTALAASRPGRLETVRDAELAAARSEIERLSETVKEQAVELVVLRGKQRSGW